jgi:hypothetical protein
MVTDWKLKILHGLYDVTEACEWSVTIEESLGQPGTMTFTLQDRYMGMADFAEFEPGHLGFNLEDLDVMATIDGQATPLFRGTLLRTNVDLPVAFPWRFHKISCTDYQREIFGRRLIGTPTGDLWWAGISGSELDEPIPVDPRVYLSGSDASVVIALMATVATQVGLIDTTTYVNTYIDSIDSLVGDPNVPQTPNRSTVGSVMDLVAALAPGNVQYWIDPDLKLHYIAIPRWWETPTEPGSLALGLPEDIAALELAPADIDNEAPDGVTSIGCRNLSYDFDYSQGVKHFYVNGSLGFAYNAGVVEYNGTGWVNDGVEGGYPPASVAQAFLNADEAIDKTTKLAVVARASKAVERGVLRGRCTVGNERHHIDGWHVGQLVRIRDDRLPDALNDRYYVIQKVTTTLIPTVNWRVYHLEWGDAPIARSSSRRYERKQEQAQLPGRLWDIGGRDMYPLSGTTVTVVGQLVDDLGIERRVSGVIVKLKLEVWDTGGSLVDGIGSIAPDEVITDAMGRWETQLTVGSEVGYKYRVSSISEAEPAP